MLTPSWDLDKDLFSLRKEFPILDTCIYLISNSLGAVPRKTLEGLQEYYRLWSEEGVSAWNSTWWELGKQVGDKVASLIGAGQNEVSMLPNATQCHWVALSTKFREKENTRNKLVMTDHDFPSSLYAVSRIAQFMGWEVVKVKSQGKPGIAVESILEQIDEKTLFVATSHVYFKSGYIQDIAAIAAKSHQVGALTLIDGYHGPGVIPINLNELNVDLYIGGCLKWLCGGPGNAFLYVNPDINSQLDPYLTGWLAHKQPFSFDNKFEFTQGAYKFLAGTPPIPSLYSALAGLDIIKSIGIKSIRKKSLLLTKFIIETAKENGFQLFSPEDEHRGGAISLILPQAFQVKQALDKRSIKVDFRKGRGDELDVIRVGPHFYSQKDEIEMLFKALREIYDSGEYKNYADNLDQVT